MATRLFPRDEEHLAVDVAIFGGGVAGLWLLDELLRQGYSAVLLEADQLGQGQTVCAQGILHGGLKYTLKGLLTASAKHIREMPAMWRTCLAGEAGDDGPNLSATRVRSDYCWLWRTNRLASKLGMIGAKVGLRVSPNQANESELPPMLRDCPGTVQKLEEQVIDPVSLLKNLASRHLGQIRKVDRDTIHFSRDAKENVSGVTITAGDCAAQVTAQRYVFTAGGGNAELLERAGIKTRKSAPMQLRPLHMTMVRGNVPALNGHCVDGAKTRVTITSDTDRAGQTVWQIGGQLAEDGVTKSPAEQIAQAKAELRAVLPGIDLAGTEWATYHVDRAEGRTATGSRPETIQISEAGHVITAWPTKMVLAPVLARQISDRLPAPQSVAVPHHNTEWPRPEVAAPPWEAAIAWTSDVPTRAAA